MTNSLGLGHSIRILLKYEEDERPRLLKNTYLNQGQVPKYTDNTVHKVIVFIRK